MAMIDIGHGISFSQKFWTPEISELFPNELLKLISRLHADFNPERMRLLEERQVRQRTWNHGDRPEFLNRNSEAVKGDWKVVTIPPELTCRRVEITGPVNSAKMVINMLNRTDDGARADMAMLDFEDSMKPIFANVLDGYKNVMGAVSGNLSYHALKSYTLNPQDMAYVMVRVRGLHLNESNVRVHGQSVSAGLLDLAVCFYHTLRLYLGQKKTPKYYVPKCEHFMEARWWNRLFTELERTMKVPVSTLRATFLIETLPAAFQVEEILYELRDHAVGLNVGRWDKIFSDIKVLRHHKDHVLADRAFITMEKTWMENYAKRIVKICHERGAFAMGGMSAFTPGKTPEVREAQTAKVRADKKREAEWGHDGCWVSHPYFIGIAMSEFKTQNQLKKTLPDFDKYSDLLPEGGGPYTVTGLRTNARVGIAYMHGWKQDLGCVAFDDLMEDLATLEISRAQTWQWLHHGILLEDGRKVTPELVEEIFQEELQKICKENPGEEVAYRRAQISALDIFTSSELPEFLTVESEQE